MPKKQKDPHRQILDELRKIAFADEEESSKLTPAHRLKALELLGKVTGLFESGELSNLEDDGLLEALRSRDDVWSSGR